MLPAQSAGQPLLQIWRAVLAGSSHGIAAKSIGSVWMATEAANTTRNTGKMRNTRAIRNGAARWPKPSSESGMTMPLSTKNTSTAAMPCENGASSQAGAAANGAMWEIMT